MNNKEDLLTLNKQYAKFIHKCSKDELKQISYKKNKTTRFYRFFSRDYFRRKNFLINGKIIYGYLYKVYNDYGLNNISLGYVIHSPKIDINMSPEKYKEIYNRLNTFLSKEKPTLKERKILNILTKNAADLKYFLISKKIIGEEMVYVSTVPIDLKKENIKIGINYFVVNLCKSKEIIMLDDDTLELIKKEEIKENI